MVIKWAFRITWQDQKYDEGRMKCKRIIMDAQKHAVSFYESLGFVVTSDEYIEEGIVHVDMSLSI